MASKEFLSNVLRLLSGPHLAFLAFIAACGYFLWTEHQAHLLAALPYLVLLLCPLMHIFMHHGHSGRHKNDHGRRHEIPPAKEG